MVCELRVFIEGGTDVGEGCLTEELVLIVVDATNDSPVRRAHNETLPHKVGGYLRVECEPHLGAGVTHDGRSYRGEHVLGQVVRLFEPRDRCTFERLHLVNVARHPVEAEQRPVVLVFDSVGEDLKLRLKAEAVDLVFEQRIH